METGRKITLMDSATTSMLMEPVIKGSGSSISKLDKGSRVGLIIQFTKASMRTAKNMAKASSSTPTAQLFSELAFRIQYLVREHIRGLTVALIKACGIKIGFMVRGSLLGQMDASTTEIMLMSGNMVMANFFGPMVEFTKVTGSTGDKKVLEHSYVPVGKKNNANGRMVNGTGK